MSKRSSSSPSETLQPTPKRPKSLPLDIGTLIEAQDVENLWFPAEVIKSNETEVRVHFLGWSERWDEWIEKDSSRLRRHRGWGTRCRFARCTPRTPNPHRCATNKHARERSVRARASYASFHVSVMQAPSWQMFRTS